VFADLFEKHRADLEPGAVLEVRGPGQSPEDAEPKMVLTAVKPLGPLHPAPPSTSTWRGVERRSPSRRSARSSFATRHQPVYFTVRGETDPGRRRSGPSASWSRRASEGSSRSEGALRVACAGRSARVRGTRTRRRE
jgi:hypothetical protein